MVVRKKRRKVAPKRAVSSKKFFSGKIKLTLTSLLTSLIVFAASWIGYEYLFLNSTFFGSLFFILVYISGFLSLAFFMVLLLFLVWKIFRK